MVRLDTVNDPTFSMNWIRVDSLVRDSIDEFSKYSKPQVFIYHLALLPNKRVVVILPTRISSRFQVKVINTLFLIFVQSHHKNDKFYLYLNNVTKLPIIKPPVPISSNAETSDIKIELICSVFFPSSVWRNFGSFWSSSNDDRGDSRGIFNIQ